jgi:hypothetical protein
MRELLVAVPLLVVMGELAGGDLQRGERVMVACGR